MEAETTAPQPRRILRMPEVERRTGRSRTSIYRDMEQGRFPRAVKIGPRAMGWDSISIDAWIAARTAV